MLRFGLEWVLIESIENGREIALTCVWKENHDLLALVLWTCCNLSCSKCCCTRRDTYEETFCLCKLTTCADSIIIINIDYLVDNVCVVCLWNKACTNYRQYLHQQRRYLPYRQYLPRSQDLLLHSDELGLHHSRTAGG